MKKDPYQLLFVDREAPPEIIKASYRALMKNPGNHPDLGGDADKAKAINEAYDILKNEKSRRELDRNLRQAGDTSGGRESRSQFGKAFFVVCLHCLAVNQIVAPEGIIKSKCAKCERPFADREAPSFRKNGRGGRSGSDRRDRRSPAPKSAEEIALYLYEKKLYFRALEDFRRLSMRDPKNPEYRYMNAMCRYRLNHFKEAKADFLKCLQLKPDHFLASVYMGRTLMKDHRFGGAIDFFDRAIAIHPSVLKPQALKGVCYYKIAKFEEALRVLSPVVDKEPAFDRAIYYLSMSLYRTRRFSEAKESFLRCMGFFPRLSGIGEMVRHCERHLNMTA